MATLPTPSPTTTSSSSKTLSTRRKNASSKWQPQCHPHVIFVLEEDDHNATCQNAHNQGRPLSKALQITLHSPTQPRKNKVQIEILSRRPSRLWPRFGTRCHTFEDPWSCSIFFCSSVSEVLQLMGTDRGRTWIK